MSFNGIRQEKPMYVEGWSINGLKAEGWSINVLMIDVFFFLKFNCSLSSPKRTHIEIFEMLIDSPSFERQVPSFFFQYQSITSDRPDFWCDSRVLKVSFS